MTFDLFERNSFYMLFFWQNGVRDKVTVLYNTALGVIFGVKKYAGRLLKVVEKRSVIDLLVSSMNTYTAKCA